MRSLPFSAKSFLYLSLRKRVALVAIVSRILCLFLVSQWPRYFHTYHTSSELLHPNVLPLQDRARWRASAQIEAACRYPWTLPEQNVTGRGHRWYIRSYQELLSGRENVMKKHTRQLSQEQSVDPFSRRHRDMTVLPLVLPVNVDGLHMLASAPLHDPRIQAFLASSDRPNFAPGIIPVTARRPLPLPTNLDGCLENQEVGNRGKRTALPGLAAAGAARAETLTADRWLWQLVMPLLSWDGEYFMTCALQRTRYYFEMTHAFFPGLSITYMAVKEGIWPFLQRVVLLIFPPSTFNVKYSSRAWSPADVPVLSDATSYGLIAVIVSLVSFVLATLAVSEIAIVFASLKSGEISDPSNDTACLKEVDGFTPGAPKRPAVSMPSPRVMGAARQRHLSPSPSYRQQTARSFKNPEIVSEPRSAMISIPTGCTHHAERDIINASVESCRKNHAWKESVAFWAAFWYAFSGASIHMSAAYTESLFACLSVWGLLLLSWAEENRRYIGGMDSFQLLTASIGKTASKSQVSRTDAFTRHEGRRGIQTTTVRHVAPGMSDPSVISQFSRGKEELHYTSGTDVTKLARQYCFSWAATLLFFSAALLRSNGSLSLIPLFFHTLRTCPGMRRIQTFLSSTVPSSKQRRAADDFRVSSTLHTATTPAKHGLSTSLVKLFVAVLLHWVNALLQALVVLLPPFLVLSYPYYLYCACPPTLAQTLSHPNARSDMWCRESRRCQVVSHFLGQHPTTQTSPACTAPSLNGSRFVQTDESTASNVSACSTAGVERSCSQSYPPSFTAFALSFVRVGLSCSLQNLTSSVEALLDGIQSVLRPEGGDVEATYTRPPWCTDSVPNVYSYVQRQYWDVEFLKFFRVKALHLIAMSIPFYAVSVLCVLHLLTRCLWPPEESCSTSCHIRIHGRHKQRRSNAEARKPGTSPKTKTRSWSRRIIYLLLEKDTGQVVQLAVLSIVMMFFAHVNVFVRLSTASPVYFLHMARLHAAYSEAITHANEHQLSRRQEASSALECRICTKNWDKNSVQEPMEKATVFVSDSNIKNVTWKQLCQLPGAAWWEWCSVFVLVHHFLGPLLFSCYITWT